MGQSLQKWDSWQVCDIAANQHNLEKFGESQSSFACRTMELVGGGWIVYALFAVNAPIIRMVSSCIVAVTVFWCSLTILILAVSPLSITQDCILLWNNPFKWVQVKQSFQVSSSETSIIPHDPPTLAHTKVSVYLTGFRNAQFRSVTLRKSISWNLAPEEKIILFPPDLCMKLLLGNNSGTQIWFQVNTHMQLDHL